MRLTKTQKFDRREWVNKIRCRVEQQKVCRVTLRQGGIQLNELLKMLGPQYGGTPLKDGEVMLAKAVQAS